jgi:Spy/CpxP family protein refolding chaperone
MKNKTLWIGAGGLIVVLIAGAALAHGGGGMHRMFMRHAIENRIQDAEDFVDATPQQRAVIDGAKNVVLDALQARVQDRKGHAGELLNLLAADKLDTDKLYALADQRAADIREMAKVIIPQVQKVHDVLTPAQRQKLVAHMQKKHERMMEHERGFGGE